jgi:acylphosphatase
MTTAQNERRRLRAVVRGFVQGVGFRWFVQRQASRLGLVGWTANLADGGVEVVAEGTTTSLDALVARLHSGPPGASVSSVDVHMGPAHGDLVDFVIRSGAHRGD